MEDGIETFATDDHFYVNGCGARETPHLMERPTLLQYCFIPMGFTLRWEKANSFSLRFLLPPSVVADGQRGL